MDYSQAKLTIGIPTYVGGPSLVKTVESLLASEGAPNFRILISVDGKQLEPAIKSALEKDPRVEVIENKVRRGQVGGIRQILSLTFDQDIVILTQDDLLFDKNAVAEIASSFEQDASVTMVTATAVPIAPITFFERIVHAGFFMVKTIEKRWNKGDNYMNAAGRCIAFRKPMSRKIFSEIQEEVISCDAHFYFINRQFGGKFLHNDRALYYFRSPKTLADHLKQSKKYQNVAEELFKYRRIDAHQEYAIPTGLKVDAAIWGLVTNPIFSLLYFGFLAYTRFHGDTTFKKATRFWDTDASTKEI